MTFASRASVNIQGQSQVILIKRVFGPLAFLGITRSAALIAVTVLM